MTTFSSDEIPERMRRRGRLVDDEFEALEYLYRRVAINDVDTSNQDRLFPDQISFYPDWSVNRSRYSEPEDVLQPNFHDLGVAGFQVQDVPKRLVSEGAVEYHWDVRHMPEEDNYAHSEVWTFKADEHITKPKLPQTIKKMFRTILSERAVIMILPK